MRKQYEAILKKIGPGFHPDDPVATYIKRDGSQSFYGNELDQMQQTLDDLWDHYGSTKIYDVGLEIYGELFPKNDWFP